MNTTQVLSEDLSLVSMLEKADVQDLSTLVDYLTDFGRVRVTMRPEVKRALLSAASRRVFTKDDILLIVHELEHYGGNKLVNRVRRQGVSYRVIVKDVAAHMGIEDDGSHPTIEALEKRILERMLEEHWKRLPTAEKSRFAELIGGVTAGRILDPSKLKDAISLDRLSWRRMAGLVSDQVVPRVRKNGLDYFRSIRSWGSKALGARALGAKAAGAGRFALPFTVPALVATTAAYGAYRFSKEDYRITVPCVVQIATIRQKLAGLPTGE